MGEQAGTRFELASGEAFSYAFKKTFVVVEPDQLSIPKTNFEKTFSRGEEVPVQGRKYIRTILDDPRVRE